ncbi:MAG TPA: glutamine synthetase beta-grasp domain-containing protein, partial [Candidatus Babeliales bacterium]|nr:glutamine synthetase beta-grasp domain-containing protein [Candidatus Babeliales bacterium]
MKRLVIILCLITPMLSYNTIVATNQLTPLPKLTPTTSGDTQLYRNSTTPTADTADENYPKNTNLIGVSFAEFVFTDLNGHLRSITTPATRIKEVLKDGLKIDGSSIAGGTAITDSDLHLTPEKNAILLPDNLRLERTALVVCEMGLDAQTPFSYDPRTVLKQVLQKLTARQLQLNVGAELEFYLIDNSTAEPWDQQGYLASSTNLESERLKQEIVATLSNAGINVEKIHHEVGPGQFEVVLNYADAIKM